MRVEGQHKAMLAQAWHGAAFYAAVKVGQLPPLAEVLDPKPATVGQRMAAALKAKGVKPE